MWDLIVSVPDHCLSFYFSYVRTVIEAMGMNRKILMDSPFVKAHIYWIKCE